MKSRIMYTIARIILGLGFIFFGGSKFFPMSSPGLPGQAMDFLNAMGATGYFIPFVGLAELIVGILLLANVWVPLALMILAPIMLNVILFNLFLAPSLGGAFMLLIIVAIEGYLMYCTWEHYKPLFTARIK